jgi:hypothetical protein
MLVLNLRPFDQHSSLLHYRHPPTLTISSRAAICCAVDTHAQRENMAEERDGLKFDAAVVGTGQLPPLLSPLSLSILSA